MDEPAAESTEREPGDLLGDRRRKLERLRKELGVDPYGRRIDGLISLAEAREKYDEQADAAHRENPDDDRRPVVKVAGRVMQHRVMGNLIFMSLRDATGDLQAAVSKKLVGPEAFKLAKLIDLSDIVTAQGPLAKTKTGEVTVWATGSQESGVRGQGSANSGGGFAIACKSLALPPGKWHGLQDEELRARKRYVDMYVNPEVSATLQMRIRIIDEIRAYLHERGFLEVETPMLQSVHGGAAARPFTTKHNALDMELYLRIAPELYLKRLLVGGFHKVFEINRNFRNEGIDRQHNPEFTMLELYEAFGSWETMADLVEDMICTVAEKILGTLVIEHRPEAPHVHAGLPTRTINLTRPWRRVRMVELVEERTKWTFDQRGGLGDDQVDLISHLFASEYSRRFVERQQQVPGVNPTTYLMKPGETGQAYTSRLFGQTGIDEMNAQARNFTAELFKRSPAEQLVEVYEKLIEPILIDPCFVTHVPSVVIPLARENKDDPYFADVYELVINGMEISPGYTELNDPDVQEKHFRHQVGDREEQQQFDEDFLEALRVGMPPAGGLGLGIDRLVMLLTGSPTIRDVIAFPLVKPRENE